MGVNLFACKGYPSISSLVEWCNTMGRVQRTFEMHGLNKPTLVVLYFGDHDPEGIDIPRRAFDSETVGTRPIQRQLGLDLGVKWERIALNLYQTQGLAPNYIKPSSSRADAYYKEFDTNECWELDALEPAQLRELATDAIADLFDQEVHDEVQAHVEEQREEMRRLLQDRLNLTE